MQVDAARILLMLACLAVLGWSGYYTALFLDDTTTKQATILVQEAHKTSFNALEYEVIGDNMDRWIATAPTLLTPGQYLRVTGKFAPFSLSSTADSTANRSKLTAGFAGRLHITRIDTTTAVPCTFACVVLKNTTELERTIRTTFLHNACQNGWFSPSSLGVSCQDVAVFSQGILIGGSTGLSPELASTIRSFGLTHIVAVSGFQVVSIVVLLEWLLSRMVMPPKHKLMLFVVVFGLFLLLVGPQAPILRALISFGIARSVLIWGGRALSPVRSLLYAALLMLIVNPFYLYSYSFWLSIAATLGVSAAAWICKTKGIKSLLGQGFMVSVGAYLATFGIIAQLNASVNAASVIANVLIGPLIPFLSLAALFSLVPVIGVPFAAITTAAVSVIFALLGDATSWFSWSILRFSARFGIGETLQYYLFLGVIGIGVWVLMKWHKKQR
jgi:ComEC/Rec2-related protein